MEDYEEDESDGLVQSTFTIPCASSSSHIDHPSRGNFPILSKYERNAGPSSIRKRGFISARKQLERAYENTFSSNFDPVIAETESFCINIQSSISSCFIPGLSAGNTAKRLTVASLVGPQVSHCFHDQLKSKITKHKGCRWVSLQPRECVSLAATIRLLVANLMHQVTSMDIGLSSLVTLSASTTAVIYLRSIALHKYSVLNDFIKAIHSASQTPKFPRIVILLGVEGGFGSLDDKVDSESMRLMDMHRISLPSPSIVFDTMIQELYFSSDADGSIWFGPTVLDMIRYQYYERGFDLDKVLMTVELAIHHHFTTRPMSAFAALSLAEHDCADWEPVCFDRLRLHIVEADIQGNTNLPQPTSDKAISKQNHLRTLLTDDGALLSSISDFASASTHYRMNVRRAILLLHTLRSHFLNQASNDIDESLLEPRRTRLGGLAWHVLSGQGVNTLNSAVVGAMKKASVRQIKDVLEDILSHDWSLEDEIFQQKSTEFMNEVQVEIDKELQQEQDMEVDLTESQRMEMIQKRLLREESSDTIKRRIADWIRTMIETWASTRPILPQVWTYDYINYITQLCDPSPRGIILAALNDSSAINRVEFSTIPDICRLYQVYQSAGKMIDLSDLFQAFSQSIQVNSKALLNKKTSHNGENGQVDSSMQRKDAVQARFALAINEMGKMGFMKKTRRKPDHVLKIVHDLPSIV